jgi:hypothetical protein
MIKPPITPSDESASHPRFFHKPFLQTSTLIASCSNTFSSTARSGHGLPINRNKLYSVPPAACSRLRLWWWRQNNLQALRLGQQFRAQQRGLTGKALRPLKARETPASTTDRHS